MQLATTGVVFSGSTARKIIIDLPKVRVKSCKISPDNGLLKRDIELLVMFPTAASPDNYYMKTTTADGVADWLVGIT